MQMSLSASLTCFGLEVTNLSTLKDDKLPTDVCAIKSDVLLYSGKSL